ncbi:MAG TPA: M42 family metallopeptidase [Firmicutes bacterium]|nr:M42 family metallopeptidase [Candidatus Fermentithermobacillaceae bacterium]
MKDLIKKVTEAFGPSGAEDSVREVIRKEVEPYVDEISVDALGNLIAHKKGTGGKKIILDGHMDEIGLMVTHIDDKGFLRFGNIGGVNPFVALGQRVYFENGTMGVIGSERVDDPKDLKLEKLFIDIGAKDKEEAEGKVSVGTSCAFYQPFVDLGDRVIAKAMDDRVACAIIIEVLKRLENTANDIYAVFATQEEVGLRGARAAAYGISPDVGIALDVTRTGDTPKSRTMDVSLGNGAAIKVKDSSLICHPALKNYMVKVAKEKGIKYQMEVLEAGGTDSAAIQMTKSGIPAGCISIPCRYIHSPCEMVDMGDVEACVQLAKALCESTLEF